MHRDRHAELNPFLRVAQSELEGGAGDPDGHRGDAGTGAVEGHHRQFEALVFFGEQVLGGDLDVVEGDRRGVRGPLTHLVLLLVDGDPGGVGVDDEGGHSAVTGVRVGLGVDREQSA